MGLAGRLVAGLQFDAPGELIEQVAQRLRELDALVGFQAQLDVDAPPPAGG